MLINSKYTLNVNVCIKLTRKLYIIIIDDRDYIFIAIVRCTYLNDVRFSQIISIDTRKRGVLLVLRNLSFAITQSLH